MRSAAVGTAEVLTPPGLRKRFSVVVLSTAPPDQDVELAYALGAQSFLVKPLQFRDLVDTFRRIKEYWLDINLLPDGHG